MRRLSTLLILFNSVNKGSWSKLSQLVTRFLDFPVLQLVQPRFQVANGGLHFIAFSPGIKQLVLNIKNHAIQLKRFTTDRSGLLDLKKRFGDVLGCRQAGVRTCYPVDH